MEDYGRLLLANKSNGGKNAVKGVANNKKKEAKKWRFVICLVDVDDDDENETSTTVWLYAYLTHSNLLYVRFVNDSLFYFFSSS